MPIPSVQKALKAGGVRLSSSDIKSAAKNMQMQLSQWRQHLHRHPELSFQETETAKFIAKNLEAIPDMTVTTGVGFPTAVMRTLKIGRAHV